MCVCIRGEMYVNRSVWGVRCGVSGVSVHVSVCQSDSRVVVVCGPVSVSIRMLFSMSLGQSVINCVSHYRSVSVTIAVFPSMCK